MQMESFTCVEVLGRYCIGWARVFLNNLPPTSYPEPRLLPTLYGERQTHYKRVVSSQRGYVIPPIRFIFPMYPGLENCFGDMQRHVLTQRYLLLKEKGFHQLVPPVRQNLGRS